MSIQRFDVRTARCQALIDCGAVSIKKKILFNKKKNGSNDPRRTYAVPASSFANHTAKYIPITRPAIRGAAEVKVRGTAEVKERNPFL
jgi:hypothetical protein